MHPINAPFDLKILVCPSGFKGSLQPQTAADCIEEGILTVLPNASVKKVPLVDGGEGFTKALVSATNGSLHHVKVTGPMGLGSSVESFFGILGTEIPSGVCSGGQADLHNMPRRTVVIEMAAAAGLSLVPSHCRNPGTTTTFGVGELILAALDAGSDRIVIGCGDSGTCDGGAGMLQALGARLLDSDGNALPIAKGGDSLLRLADIDLTHLDTRLSKVRVEAAVNWANILCGPGGVARVFGTQKGASCEQIGVLSSAMEAIAQVASRLIDDSEVGSSPGGGASGGLGTGLRLIGAALRPRYELLAEYIKLDTLFDGCDLVVTAEGGIDEQTPLGKIPGEVAMRSKKIGIPVVAIAGTIGRGAQVNYSVGIDAFTSILQKPATLEEAIDEAERLTKESAESIMRMIGIGSVLATRKLLGAI